MLGPERKSHILSVNEKKITAYHEMGHAIVGHFLEHTDPVHKISVVSRGQALGYAISDIVAGAPRLSADAADYPPNLLFTLLETSRPALCPLGKERRRAICSERRWAAEILTATASKTR